MDLENRWERGEKVMSKMLQYKEKKLSLGAIEKGCSEGGV